MIELRDFPKLDNLSVEIDDAPRSILFLLPRLSVHNRTATGNTRIAGQDIHATKPPSIPANRTLTAGRHTLQVILKRMLYKYDHRNETTSQ
jgi:hypothetical protein